MGEEEIGVAMRAGVFSAVEEEGDWSRRIVGHG
jgi:hypothetical protein